MTHRVFRCVLSIFAPLIFAAGAMAAQNRPASGPRTVAQLVYLFPGSFDKGSQPDGNSVVFAGNGGWIVFDTGRHPDHALRILDFVRASDGRIDAIINSHWHLDHVGGNARIRRDQPGARVYASPAFEIALHGWLQDYRAQLEQMVADPKSRAADRESWRTEIALIDSGRQLLPDVRIKRTRNLTIAERPLRVGLETDAVTGGDLWLYDRRSRVLAAGDLVTLPVPFFDTACPQRWSVALGGLEDLPFERLVPGHGPVLDRHAYTEYRMAFDALLACAESERGMSECADAWITATGRLDPDADPARSRELLDYYFARHLRAPQPQRERFCPRAAPSS